MDPSEDDEQREKKPRFAQEFVYIFIFLAAAAIYLSCTFCLIGLFFWLQPQSMVCWNGWSSEGISRRDSDLHFISDR